MMANENNVHLVELILAILVPHVVMECHQHQTFRTCIWVDASGPLWTHKKHPKSSYFDLFNQIPIIDGQI
jgi:hypothetical protein